MWVLRNKLRVTLGRPIPFARYIDYADVEPSPHVERVSYLERRKKAVLVRGRNTTEARYPLKVFENL